MKKTGLVNRWTSENCPRRTGQHKNRGPSEYSFSISDVAGLSGVEESTVRAALRFSERVDSEGKLKKKSSFKEIFAFVFSRVARRSARVSEAELRDLLEDRFDLWEKRWPRFDLWTCGVPDCDELRLGSGICERHGGGVSVDLTDDGQFRVRVGDRWESLPCVFLGAPTGTAVAHKDGNRWNCRLSNLETEK